MKAKAQPRYALKDVLFNSASVSTLASAIQQVYPEFCQKSFLRNASQGFEALTLKERIDHLAAQLETQLPGSLPKALSILKRALPAPLNPKLGDKDFGEFIWAVPSQFAARRGCHDRHLDVSLRFLRECTKRFSAEFALRPFLQCYPMQTLEYVRQWALDDNYHVRRLASEGIRPRLPWAEHLDIPTQTILDVLDLLYNDNAQFVRRSVANNLNDLSKIDPKLTLSRVEKWQNSAEASENSATTRARLDWIIKHGLRTQLKTGKPQALALLGYTATPVYRLSALNYDSKVSLGGAFEYHAKLESRKAQRLLITLNLYYLKANNSHSVKSYKVLDRACQAGECIALQKKIAFKPMSTRSLYPGHHFAQLQINGQVKNKLRFELTF